MPSVPGIPQSLPLLPSAGSLAPAPAVPTTSAPSLHPEGLQSVLGLLPPVSQSQGLILSSALEPIPARLVGRITSGQFIEMRDLLTDNIALHDQLEVLQGTYHLTTLPNSIRSRVREVPSLISWVYCFMAYVATRTSDTQTRDMLTYCRLLIQEALRHGGSGWQEYDRNFRRQLAINPSLPWNTLLPDLQATTILGQRTGGGTFCHLCRGMDHTSANCALTFFSQQTIPPPTGAAGTNLHTPRRPLTRSSTMTKPETLMRICSSWNMGLCAYPGSCTFRHICATCQLAHRARDCLDTPEDSPYKRRRRPQAGSAQASTATSTSSHHP